MLVFGILLLVTTLTGQTLDDVKPFDNGYTNYRESSTDNCAGTVSICTEELPFNISNPPDVWLDAVVSVPTIELTVSNLRARLNLDAKVASLVTLKVGVSVGITSVKLKIHGVRAQVQLAVKFDKVVEIVDRTLKSLDLNPVLASTVKGVQSTVDKIL